MNWVNPLRVFVCTGTFILALAVSSLGHADTILKLNLGSDPAADIQFDGTELSTIVDGNGISSGNQDTTIDFLGFLSSMIPNPLVGGSFTLENVLESGAANTSIPGMVFQGFTGGDFYLYDNFNALLLSGTLGTSSLAGPLGVPATGGVFTTSLGSVNGGSLAGLIDPNSISMAISMTSVNGTAGLGVTSGSLNNFTAEATLSIAADQRPIPEPATAVMILVGGVLLSFAFRRRA